MKLKYCKECGQSVPSAQRRWQLKMKAARRCVQCGFPLEKHEGVLCSVCQENDSERKRRYRQEQQEKA